MVLDSYHFYFEFLGDGENHLVICEGFFEVGRLESEKCFLQFKALASVLYLNITAGIFREKGLQFLSGVG